MKKEASKMRVCPPPPSRIAHGAQGQTVTLGKPTNQPLPLLSDATRSCPKFVTAILIDLGLTLWMAIKNHHLTSWMSNAHVD